MDAVNLSSPEPTFETHGRKTKPQINLAFVVLGLGLLAVLVIGWIVLQQFIGGSSSEPSPTPQVQSATDEATPEPIRDLENVDKVDKKDIKVEVLNGTGIAKEASLLEEKLKKSGFELIETGNADNKAYDVAQVSFGETITQEIKDEVLKILTDTYSEIKETKLKSSSTFEISIITGLRPGVERPTPKPSTSTTASPSATPQ